METRKWSSYGVTRASFPASPMPGSYCFQSLPCTQASVPSGQLSADRRASPGRRRSQPQARRQLGSSLPEPRGAERGD